MEGILNGVMYSISKVTSSNWFRTKEYLVETTSAIPDATKTAITQAYSYGINAAMLAAAKLGETNLDYRAFGWTTSYQNLNFKDKSQEEIADMLQSAVSTDLDDFAKRLVPWVEQFQQVNEDLFETMGRLVYETESVERAFNQLGGELQVTGKFAVDITQTFIKASGGLENALSNVNGFIDNFYTEYEKQKLREQQILGRGGVLYGVREYYKQSVEKMRIAAEMGDMGAAETLANMLAMQDTYNDYFDYIEKKEQELADLKEEQAEEELERQKELAEKIAEAKRKMAEDELAFHQDILRRIEEAYSGTLNYMNSAEKAAALAGLAQVKFNAGDTQGYFDTLYSQLESEKRISATREEYAVKFNSYTSSLQNAEFEPKTTDDVVDSLEEILEQNRRIEDAIEHASFQAPL